MSRSGCPELDDVLGGDQFRGERARDQKMVRVVRVPDADMAVGVDHVLLRQDAVGNHQILDGGVEAGHGGHYPSVAGCSRLTSSFLRLLTRSPTAVIVNPVMKGTSNFFAAAGGAVSQR